MADTSIKVTQTRGLSHKPNDQRLIIKGLGLRRIGHTVTLRDNPAIRGMIMKVQHLVEVELVKGEAPLFGGRHRDAHGKPAAKKAAKKAK
jgi:large subunit ribosomal protein L30